jgi:hypothetical protein
MDFDGLHSFDGGRTLRSECDFEFALLNVGGLMYFVHGEKFTRLERRLERAPVDPFVENEESPGV